MDMWLERFDAGVLGWFADQRTPALDAFFAAVTWGGSLWLVAPASVVLAAVAWRNRQPMAGWLLVLGPLTASLAGWSVKLIVARPRPDALAAVITLPPDFSFPSGHATQAAAFALASLLALGRGAPMARRTTLALALAATGYVLLVAASRLYLQVHFPSDVVAGLALGLVWVAVCHAALRRRPPPAMAAP